MRYRSSQTNHDGYLVLFIISCGLLHRQANSKRKKENAVPFYPAAQMSRYGIELVLFGKERSAHFASREAARSSISMDRNVFDVDVAVSDRAP